MVMLWHYCFLVCEVMASMSMTWCEGTPWAIRASEACALIGRIDELIVVPVESERACILSWRSVGGMGACPSAFCRCIRACEDKGTSWWCCMPWPLSAQASEVISFGITELQRFVSIEWKLYNDCNLTLI